MKNLITSFVFLLLSITVSTAQTQPNLPAGSKAFSSSIFIAPNADLWTGKTGTYMNLAKKRYIDSLWATIPSLTSVKPSGLNINASAVTPSNDDLVLAATALNLNNEWKGSGIVASSNYATTGALNSLVLRKNGTAAFAPAVSGTNPIIKEQFDAAIGNFYSRADNSNTSITGSSRSYIMISTDSKIQSAAGGYQNLIMNSNNGTIEGVKWNSLIGTNNCTIGDTRQTSAIIASSDSEITDGQVAPGFLKWNSAIIAAYLCKVGASNSYTLVTGRGNESNGSAQFVCGRYNLIEPLIGVNDPNKKAFIVGAGQGQDDSAIVRGNAAHITHGGKFWIKNEMEVDKAGGALVLKSPNGTRWSITVSNTGQLTTTQLPN